MSSTKRRWRFKKNPKGEVESEEIKEEKEEVKPLFTEEEARLFEQAMRSQAASGPHNGIFGFQNFSQFQQSMMGQQLSGMPTSQFDTLGGAEMARLKLEVASLQRSLGQQRFELIALKTKLAQKEVELRAERSRRLIESSPFVFSNPPETISAELLKLISKYHPDKNPGGKVDATELTKDLNQLRSGYSKKSSSRG
jgi:curved DNA-binding protein CbpA